jgi:hypothetical protein
MKFEYRDRDLRMARQCLAVQAQLLDLVIDERDSLHRQVTRARRWQKRLLAEIRTLREERDQLLRQIQVDGRPACHEWDNTSLKHR